MTDSGDAIILFRAPVTSRNAAGESQVDRGGRRRGAAADGRNGGVEVAISKRAMQAQQRGILVKTMLMALVLIAVPGLLGFVPPGAG